MVRTRTPPSCPRPPAPMPSSPRASGASRCCACCAATPSGLLGASAPPTCPSRVRLTRRLRCRPSGSWLKGAPALRASSAPWPRKQLPGGLGLVHSPRRAPDGSAEAPSAQHRLLKGSQRTWRSFSTNRHPVHILFTPSAHLFPTRFAPSLHHGHTLFTPSFNRQGCAADAADEIWAGWGSEAGWTQRPSRLTREDQRAGVVARFPEGAGDALRRARELLEVIITVL